MIEDVKSETQLIDWETSDHELTALIVDLHGFTKMCAHEESICMGQFIRDIFYGSVKITEENGGIVANTMGDAILCIFNDPERALYSSWGIIRDFWNQYEYLVGNSKLKSNSWRFIEEGIFCRCSFETGYMEKSELPVREGFLTMWTGCAINYADRIIKFPEKFYRRVENQRNTIVLGPRAFGILKDKYRFEHPIEKVIKGEKFIGYPYDTRDLWGD